VRARTENGTDIYYEAYDFTEPWREAETILLHHGLRANHRFWFEWIPQLARAYKVIVFDARGRGKSHLPPPGYNWSLEQFAGDVLAVVDDAGVEQFHYVGNSFGGTVGAFLAATDSSRLKTLTLVSAPYRFDHKKHLIAGMIEEMRTKGTLEYLRREVPKMFPDGYDPEVVGWHVQQMAMVPDHVASDLLTFESHINLSTQLPKISVPTLIIGAAKSNHAPAEEAQFMHEHIPGSRLVLLDSHHHILVTAPERCCQEILSFLSETSMKNPTASTDSEN
jgi:3-oxoadipate enol-lactonase